MFKKDLTYPYVYDIFLSREKPRFLIGKREHATRSREKALSKD